MPDRWGGVPVPLVTPAAGQPTTDPALGALLPFLQAFMTKDANATAAWQVTGIDPSNPPILTTFPYNPKELAFSSTQCPALFGWRDTGSSDWLSDDTMLHTWKAKLLWVMSLGSHDQLKPRAPFVNGLINCIDLAIERSRTPSWVQAGDTDPNAAVLGSFLGTYAGSWSIALESWKHERLIALGDGKRLIFPAVEMTLEIVDDLQQDPTRSPPYYALDAVNGVQLTVIDAQSGQTRVVGKGIALLSWSASLTVAQGNYLAPAPGAAFGQRSPATGYYYVCSTAGVTGTSQPIWPNALGATVLDGTAVWTCFAALPLTS